MMYCKGNNMGNEIYAKLFHKLDNLDKSKPYTIAIDGGSASGKSTLSQLISQRYDCNVFHMDDFFLRLEQRTEERLKTPGGNVDLERFIEEVASPLKSALPITYRKFRCKTMELSSPINVAFKNLVVIEGAYSMHEKLSDLYDFSVFLDISKDLQKERILKRNDPESAQMFFDRWIPLEQYYFREMNVKSRCDMVISID